MTWVLHREAQFQFLLHPKESKLALVGRSHRGNFQLKVREGVLTIVPPLIGWVVVGGHELQGAHTNMGGVGDGGATVGSSLALI